MEINWNQRGEFVIPIYVFRYHTEVAMDILKQCLPYKIEYDYAVSGFRVYAYSNLFSEVDDGCEAPKYILGIHRDEDKITKWELTGR